VSFNNGTCYNKTGNVRIT